MSTSALRCRLVLTLAALAACLPSAPAVSAPSHTVWGHDKTPDPFARIEDRQAQNRVFPGHDGHIMPPTPEDWARYHAAEAKLNAERPLFPCPPQQDGHRRHKKR